VAAAEAANRRLVASAAEAAKLEGVAEGIEVTETLPPDPDLCLVLGGDGSILWALRQYAGTGVPGVRDQLRDGRLFGRGGTPISSTRACAGHLPATSR